MYRTIALALISCVAMSAQNSGNTNSNAGPLLNRICVYDGLKYKTLISAMNDCGSNGPAVIPPTYSGQDPANANNPAVMDFRRPERIKNLTPVTAFGAKGDALTGADASSQAGSATLTTTSSPFARGRDEGKAIVITGAGAENSSLTTTIKAIESPNRITLADPAGFTSTGLTYWFGTENTAAIQAAYNSRKLLSLPPGKYLMTGTVKGTSPLFLAGAGTQSVIIDDTTVFYVRGANGHFVDNIRMQSATKLAVLPPRAFPTRYAGTPVAVDRIGAGIGYEPEGGDEDIWPKLSKQQQSQQIGPTLMMASDGTHIYRITGELVSILLFDVQFSEVASCDFRGGKNFVGGIALWHTPKDGAANRQDSIHDNTVRYASFSGIAWAAADNVSVRNNVTEYDGESGLKNYSSQGDGTYNTNIELIKNHTQHNHYDGLDLSETYPHNNSQRASSIASGNYSGYNDRTGSYVDGLEWKLIDNTFEYNGLSGMSLDVSNSVISGNILRNNNTLHEARSHQMYVGPGRPCVNNIIENNHIEANAQSGAAIRWTAVSTGNQLRGNTATGGALFKLDAAPVSSKGNSDSRGRLPDR